MKWRSVFESLQRPCHNSPRSVCPWGLDTGSLTVSRHQWDAHTDLASNSVCCILKWLHNANFFFFSQQIVEDWKFIAQVLDRLFLWTFLLVSIIGSLGLFVPVIYKWANIIVPINIGNANKWYFPRDWSRNLLTKKHITLWYLYNHENVNCV